MLNLSSKKCLSNLFLALFSAIFLASCATPRPILRIIPKETDKIRYWQGKEIVTLQNDSVKIIISYDRQNNYAVGDFSMDCSITNLSTQDILIKPEAFYYLTEKMINKTSYAVDATFINNNQKKETRAKVSAMNPENAILNAEIRQSMQEAEAKNQRTREGISQVTSAVSLSANVVKSLADRNASAEQRQQNSSNLQTAVAINMQASQLNALNNEIRRQNVAQQTENFINNLHNVPLRKTTLGQGQEVNGKLIFKFYTAYKELTFVFKVGDSTFEVPYLQTIIIPKF